MKTEMKKLDNVIERIEMKVIDRRIAVTETPKPKTGLMRQRFALAKSVHMAEGMLNGLRYARMIMKGEL